MGKRKYIRYVALMAAGLIILVLLWRMIGYVQYRSAVPQLPDLSALAPPLRQQITEAAGTALRRPTASHLGQLGMVYHSCARYEEASECYRLAIRRSRSGWTWDYYRGFLMIEMGETAAAIEHFKWVTGINPHADLAHYYLGALSKNMGDYDGAERAFGMIADRELIPPAGPHSRQDHFPISTYARFELSRIYYETGRKELAAETLTAILGTHPAFGPAYRLLGNIYRMEGEDSLGEKYSIRANDLTVYSPPVDTLVDRISLLSRSDLYLLKKIDEAERSIYSEWSRRLVDHAMQYLPDNGYLLSKAIKIKLWMGLHEEAIALVEPHLAYFADNLSEMKKMGLNFMQEGLYRQAVWYIERASELDPRDPEVLRNLAQGLWYLDEKERSREIIDALLESQRDDPEALAGVAEMVFFNMKDTERATLYLARLRQLAPSHPKLLKISAGMAEQKGAVQEAITLYEASFSEDPADLNTIKYLGNLLYDRGMWDPSLRLFTRALEYHPNEPYLQERVGTLLVASPEPGLRNLEEGVEYLQRAFLNKSSRTNTLVSAGRSLAFAYASLGELPKAITTIRETINIGRREQISPSYQAELEELYRAFLEMSEANQGEGETTE